MKPLIEQHRIRYPPFEAARWEPNALPIAEQDHEVGRFESVNDAQSALAGMPPAFRLGDDQGWLME